MAAASSVVRFRLRFLLQEIDLPGGETVIGRSPACHVTIDDPLVSRRHAVLRIQDGNASVEDLGSRNGLRVNGNPVEGITALRDGDRIRVGTQELVLCVVEPRGERAGTRPTGFLCRCAACGVPYPAEAVSCPSCGSTERVDEETLSGVVSKSDQNWTLQLLVEVLGKAVELGRWDDAERLLRRSRANVEERLATSHTVERAHLDVVAETAAHLAGIRTDGEWARWVLDIHHAAATLPSEGTTARLADLPAGVRSGLGPSVEKLVEGVQARGGPTDEDRARYEAVATLVPGAG